MFPKEFIKNYRFLKKLPRLLRTNKAMSMIDTTDLKGCDWGEGCCLVLAHALFDIIGGTVYYIKSRIGYEHAILRIGNLYIDHNGIYTRKQTLLYWQKELIDRKPISIVKSRSFSIPNGMGYDYTLRDLTVKYLKSYIK